MHHLLKRSLVGLTALAIAVTANAHIVGITWNFQPNGDVSFDALHWHGDLASNAGIGTAALTVNGNNYTFTSYTNNVSSYSGVGGLDNYPTYSDWTGADSASPGQLNVTSSVNDWLHVTVPASAFNLPVNTLNSTPGPGQLSQWTLTGGVTTIEIVVPPPTNSVPDSGASVALLGVGLASLAGCRRFFKRNTTA